MRCPQKHLSVLGAAWAHHCPLPYQLALHTAFCFLRSLGDFFDFCCFSITPCVICPFSFFFGSETGDHGNASTLVNMVGVGAGGVYNVLLCLSLQICFHFELPGSHIHKMLEYFLVFQRYCFFEHISIVRLRQAHIPYFT